MFVVFAIVFVSIVGANSLQLVPIVQWGGNMSMRNEVLKNPVNLVIVQHTVTHECNADDECVELLKTIRKVQISLGYDDIGYSFLIGGNGVVYEGAGWHLAGAHTRGYNNKALGVVFIGNFSEKLPSAEALQAAKDLFKYGVDNQHISGDYQLVGHRQLTPSISPGDALYAEIQGWPQWSDYSV